MKKVLIYSGFPGSGKSTHAKQSKSDKIHSADNFFLDMDENYNFDPERISDAHKWCFRQFLADIEYYAKFPDDAIICVDNTNISAWEISPYLMVAVSHGFEVEIVEIHCDPEVAFKRQTHGVPKKSFDSMVHRFQNRHLPPWWKVAKVDNS